ncbi:MAG: hypothetical protein M9945_14080 [Aquamicrobium sp.]|uniref:hypothetical protein n=1 Tax=Aquamicrobium sp. TaxID=1872579 RepID=UPI00349F0069|nr:hypothetical protein [Aquamicrobium sp.]
MQSLGPQGEAVWTVGKTIDDKAERLAYLVRSIAFIREKAMKPDTWRSIPVDFQTFVEAPTYLNKKGALWPAVMQQGLEMNSGRYMETVLTGAIGVAKTTLALYTQAYQVYLLSCLADPHKLFDLDSSSEILIVFQSINKHLAHDVDYRRFRDMIENGPYFRKNYLFDTGLESQLVFPRNVIVKPVAGHDTAAIGQNVIGGIIDEVNFMAVVENSKQKRDGGTYDQAVQNYNSIARRRESRFMQMGVLPGMLCLVSSRNYPGQFTDKKEEEARRQIAAQGFTTIFVYDKRLWELRPERFCGDRFRVFIGDETRKPRILEPDEAFDPEDAHLIDHIPVEYRSSFENDILASLRDIAGKATLALHPFILNTEAVDDCFGTTLPILSREDCDFKSTKIQVYPKRIVNPFEPRFAHIDLAVSKDSAGVTVGHVPGFVDMNRGEHVEALPLIQYDFILEVRPPRGGEIEFENIRKLLYTLRDKIKLPIKWVTFDQYQSRDSMQVLHNNGFIVGYQSMDTDTYAYDLLKQAFYDKRVRAPEHPKAQKEVITLEIDKEKNKIDHPPNGSKDVSDSMAGVAIGLTNRREIWVKHKVPLHKRPQFQRPEKAGKNSIDRKEQRDEYYNRADQFGREVNDVRQAV